jgi:hypothetical protein
MNWPVLRGGDGEHTVVADLITGMKVSLKSAPGRYEKPRTTHMTLYRSNVPSPVSLCLNNHLTETMFAPGGHGTSVQVLSFSMPCTPHALQLANTDR